MSDLHAETALWIDGLHKRADTAEKRLSTCQKDAQHRRDADERLARFRKGLGLMGNDQEPTEIERSTLEKMADDLDCAVADVLARFRG